MPRYIDVSLYEDCRIVCNSEDKGVPVKDIPTADVQKVRHGKWDEIRDAYGKLEGWIHRDCGRLSMAMENYCPKCGALMDGKE